MYCAYCENELADGEAIGYIDSRATFHTDSPQVAVNLFCNEECATNSASGRTPPAISCHLILKQAEGRVFEQMDTLAQPRVVPRVASPLGQHDEHSPRKWMDMDDMLARLHDSVGRLEDINAQYAAMHQHMENARQDAETKLASVVKKSPEEIQTDADKETREFAENAGDAYLAAVFGQTHDATEYDVDTITQDYDEFDAKYNEMEAASQEAMDKDVDTNEEATATHKELSSGQDTMNDVDDIPTSLGKPVEQSPQMGDSGWGIDKLATWNQ